ncbi:unnamed protein product, partial [Polarella glacialis]
MGRARQTHQVTASGRCKRNSNESKEAVSSGPWICPACSYKNSGFLPYCEVCETPKEGEELEEELPDYLSTAPGSDATSVGASGSSSSSSSGGSGSTARKEVRSSLQEEQDEGPEGEDEEEEEEGVERAEWACHVCSLLNPGILPYCEMCE